jgi:hypothetical protein
LKPLPKVPKPLLSGGNSTSPIGTAPTGTAPTSTTPTSTTPTGTAPTGTTPIGTASAGIIASSIIDNSIGRTDISTDPYKLNKLNTGKPGFIKDRKIIIGYKFKYFRKSNKKGQVYSRQLFITIGLQACPYITVLSCKDFTRNTVNIYLNCTYIIEVGRRIEKDEFVKILYTAAESCRPEPLKEPTIYTLYKRKEGNPIWI